MADAGQPQKIKVYQTQKTTFQVSLPSDYSSVSDYIFNFTVKNSNSSDPIIEKEWTGSNNALSGYSTAFTLNVSDTNQPLGEYKLAELWMRDEMSDAYRIWPIQDKEGHFYILPSAKNFLT